MISIHALREESDIILFLAAILQTQISIHALREESDRRRDTMIYRDGNFNPRSPWGERQSQNAFINRAIDISIHALREESDRMGYKSISKTVQFQSTLSVRRATLYICWLL